MPVIAAAIVAPHTGIIMLVALVEFNDALIAITVVGINCKDAVFKTINIAIELDTVSFFSFS